MWQTKLDQIIYSLQKYWGQFTQNLKDKDVSHETEPLVNERFLTPLSKHSLRQQIDAYREQNNIVSCVDPDYTLEELRPLQTNKHYFQYLKHRQNPVNVNIQERRLNAIQAYFYNFLIIPEITVIDTMVVQYINYYHANMMPTLANLSRLKDNKPDTQVEFDSRLLNAFTNILIEYDNLEEQQRILPLDFFTYRLLNVWRVDDVAIEQFYQTRDLVQYCLTASSILFDRVVPESYLCYDAKSHAFYNSIYQALNNIKRDKKEVQKDKSSHLTLIK